MPSGIYDDVYGALLMWCAQDENHSNSAFFLPPNPAPKLFSYLYVVVKTSESPFTHRFTVIKLAESFLHGIRYLPSQNMDPLSENHCGKPVSHVSMISSANTSRSQFKVF